MLMAANGRERGNSLNLRKSCSVMPVLHADVKEIKGMREATGVILRDPSFF